MVGLKRKLIRLLVGFASMSVIAAAAAFGASAYDANTNLLKQYEQTKGSGVVNVGIYGSYIDDITNAINRVNAIRKEACDQGVWDPRNSSRRLTSSDYVPIQWSHELEEVARLRAAEAAMNIDHTRPNGQSCFTVTSTVSSSSEVLAWNYSKNMVNGINQFYSEKSSWVNKDTSAVTGHYTSMINPNNKYMGLGCFYSNSKVSYPNTLCGRFSSSTKTSTKGSAVSNCYVPVQVKTSNLTNASIKRVSGSDTMTAGQTASYEMWADAKYSTSTDVLLYEAVWTTSNASVAAVDKYGKVTAVGGGTATITASCGGLTKSVSISVKMDISKLTINLSGTSFEYTGSQIKPAVSFSNTTYTLTNGKDYTLTYSNNINAGTASVTITGIGSYGGTVTKSFTIKPKTLTNQMMSIPERSYAYTGTPIMPAVTVKDGSKSLVKGTDYTLAFSDNTVLGSGAKAVITGKGNYMGTASVTFSIVPRPITSLDFTLSSNRYDYDGKAKQPSVTVKFGTKALLLNTDFTVAYSNNTAIGTAKVTVTGKGNYTGAKELTFKIYPNSMRIAGNDRFNTSVEVSKASFTSANTVVIASGMDYADALAGVSVARAMNSPILLVSKDTVSSDVLAEIKRLKAANALILGGEGAVGKQVENILILNGLKTERLAGKSRFETAVYCAQKLKNKTSAPKSLFIVYYNSYADALSASNAAAMQNAPVLYVNKSGEVDNETKEFISSVRSSITNVYIVGGTGVISEQMSNSIKVLSGKTPVRLAGKDRYETCVEVNKKFASLASSTSICVATGSNFPDALSGSVYSALNGTALFLADNSLNSAQTSYLKSKTAKKLIVFGGSGAVSEATILLIKQNSV